MDHLAVFAIVPLDLVDHLARLVQRISWIRVEDLGLEVQISGLRVSRFRE